MTATEPIVAFADAARRFCAFCETQCPLSNDELLDLARLLAELNRAALDLPDAFDEGDVTAANAVQPLPPGTWAAPLHSYWDVFNPLTLNPEEPVANSLEDDVRDIYMDLKKGLAQYDRGHPIAAAWDWRFSFWSHWGGHLVGAQRAIYFHFSTLGSGES
jgi:hypothetical protein